MNKYLGYNYFQIEGSVYKIQDDMVVEFINTRKKKVYRSKELARYLVELTKQ